MDIDGTIARWSDYDISSWNGTCLGDFEPYEDSVEVLRSWSQRGIEIVYITFRDLQFQDMTYEWLRRHNYPNSGKVYFNDSFTVKSEIVRKIGGYGIVEDNSSVVRDCLSQGQYVFLHDIPSANSASLEKNDQLILWRNWKELDGIMSQILEGRFHVGYK